jgi:hypothetical protein
MDALFAGGGLADNRRVIGWCYLHAAEGFDP